MGPTCQNRGCGRKKMTTVVVVPTPIEGDATPLLFEGRWEICFGDHQKKGELLGSCWSNGIASSPPIWQFYGDEGWYWRATGCSIGSDIWLGYCTVMHGYQPHLIAVENYEWCNKFWIGWRSSLLALSWRRMLEKYDCWICNRIMSFSRSLLCLFGELVSPICWTL